MFQLVAYIKENMSRTRNKTQDEYISRHNTEDLCKDSRLTQG